MAKTILMVTTLVLLATILVLFLRKASLQLQYLRVQQKKEAGSLTSFFKFSYQDTAARNLRWQAFLLFPLLYGVPMHKEDTALMDLKKQVKRTHIFIYVALIFLVFLGVYSQKIFIPIP